MPKSKLQKSDALEKIKSQIANAKSIVFTDFKGAKMTDLQEIRKNIKSKGGKFEITKTTLATKAFDNIKVKEIVNKASLALGYSNEDEVSTAKEIKAYGKKNPSIKILGGFYEGNFLDAAAMMRLADIPSKEELVGKLLGVLNNPLSKTLRILGDQSGKLVRTLQAVVDKG